MKVTFFLAFVASINFNILVFFPKYSDWLGMFDFYIMIFSLGWALYHVKYDGVNK
ncbi:hypothetical protein ACX1HR_04460 [Yersinia enterocolitica]